MGTEGLSFARVERLLLRLPLHSRLFTKLQGNKIVWTSENEQLACIFDALALSLWQKENESKKVNQQTKKPERYPRPGDEHRAKQEKAKRSELAVKLLAQKERLSIGKGNVQDQP